MECMYAHTYTSCISSCAYNNTHVLTFQREVRPKRLGARSRAGLCKRFVPTIEAQRIRYGARGFCGRFSKSGDVFTSVSQGDRLLLCLLPLLASLFLSIFLSFFFSRLFSSFLSVFLSFFLSRAFFVLRYLSFFPSFFLCVCNTSDVALFFYSVHFLGGLWQITSSTFMGAEIGAPLRM